MVATNSHSRCREQGIPFYRFSPKLKDVIAGSETDNEKLFNMVIQTRIDTREQGMEELVEVFHKIAKASSHLAPRREEQEEEEVEEVKTNKEEGLTKTAAKAAKKVEKEEKYNANVSRRPNHLLDPYLRAYSDKTALSDIEESSSELSPVKTPVHRHASSPSIRPKFLVGNEAEAIEDLRTSFGYKVEVEGQKKRPTTMPAATTTSLGQERSGVNTSSDQSASEIESQTSDRAHRDELEVTRSAESSADLTSSSSELQASSRKDKDDGSGEYTRFQVFLCEDSGEQSSLKESDGNDERDGNFSDSVERHVGESVIPRSTGDQMKVVEDATSCQLSPSPPLHQEFASQETLRDTEGVSSTACVGESDQRHKEESTSCDREAVSGKGKEEGELEEGEGWTDQKQQEGDESEGDASGTALNGSRVVGDPIPEGSAHSLLISLESPQVGGPHKRKIPRIEQDDKETVVLIGLKSEHALSSISSDYQSEAPTISDTPVSSSEAHNRETVVLNGLKSVAEECAPPSGDSTTSNCRSETPPTSNGHISSCKTRTQFQELQNVSPRPNEAPNHYKLNVQLTPQANEASSQNNFPYKYETEI